MPKKKTGQRRKAEKQKLRQKEIRTAKDQVDLAKFPCNAVMVSNNIINQVTNRFSKIDLCIRFFLCLNANEN